jgi:VCBS repeat-containing protein
LISIALLFIFPLHDLHKNYDLAMNFTQKIRFSLVTTAVAFSLVACGGDDNNNSAPEFLSAYSFTLDEDTNFTDSVSATDANINDVLSYTLVSAASNGVFSLDINGGFTYTPNQDFVGEDTVTIAASDGKATASTTVIFIVANVNDAPVLETTNVVVNSEGETSGTLEVTDADNDSIEFAVVTAPTAGTLDLDSSTGAFTYTPASLEQIDQSFTVSFTDNNISTPIEAIIELQPAFVTNADKLNYYYASEFSHLKFAENLVSGIDDDEAEDEVIAEIAKGYYLAGYQDKGAELLASIGQNDVKGEALRSIAAELDYANKTELANTLRTQALSVFNQYLAEKGLDNISSNDASFYQGLMNDYLDAGEGDLAENLLATITIYADAIKEDEYSTAYGRFVQAANSKAGDRVEQYLATFAEDDRVKAEFAIDSMAYLAENIGYAQSGGVMAYRTRTFYLSYVAEYYYIVQAFEKSKEYSAKTLSYFTAVNYDADYSFEADVYAEATYNSSLLPVETVAGLIAGLYPSLETNPALAIIDPEDGDYEDAQEEIFAYQIVNDLLDGATVAEASQAAYDYFVTEKADIRTFYEVLVDENLGERAGKAALKLIAMEENELAITVLNYAFDNVLNTQAYVEDAAGLSTDRYITGDWGCHRVISLLNNLGQDVTAEQAACKTLADTYLTSDAGLVSTSVSREAYKNLISSYAITGDTEGMLTVAGISAQETALLTDDAIDQLNGYLEIASALATYGVTAEAGDYLASGLSVISNILENETLSEDLIDDILGEVLDYGVSDDAEVSSSGYGIYTLESALRRQAGMDANYATELPAQLSALQNSIGLITTASLTLSDNELQGVMEDLINVNAYAGLYDEATSLVADDVNAVADVTEYSANLAQIIATQDDFPASDIAFIDTDMDGQPNFFLLSATDEQILASGLSADQDSDGDGIDDEFDSAPLSAD